MQAYKTEAEVGGDGRVTIEGLPFGEGERMEVIALRADAQAAAGERDRHPLRGLPVEYDDPFGSAAERVEHGCASSHAERQKQDSGSLCLMVLRASGHTALAFASPPRARQPHRVADTAESDGTQTPPRIPMSIQKMVAKAAAEAMKNPVVQKKAKEIVGRLLKLMGKK